MRLSELEDGAVAREEEKLPFPRSTIADPPITAAEARAAETAICRFHNGRIAHSPVTSDKYGNAYFCPVGRCYWRYSRQDAGMYAPLDYSPTGLV